MYKICLSLSLSVEIILDFGAELRVRFPAHPNDFHNFNHLNIIIVTVFMWKGSSVETERG